jgi:hypothetical protein
VLLLAGREHEPPGERGEVQYHDVHPSINITGPIVKDRLFFALFHQYRDAGTPVSFAAGGGIVVQAKGSTNLDKLTWLASPRNKLSFQVQADPILTGPLGVDAFTDPGSGYDGDQGGPTYLARWNANIGPRLAVESILAASHTVYDVIPVTDRIKNTCVRDPNGQRRLDPYGNPGGQSIDETLLPGSQLDDQRVVFLPPHGRPDPLYVEERRELSGRTIPGQQPRPQGRNPRRERAVQESRRPSLVLRLQ